jgi:hypothetical protein
MNFMFGLATQPLWVSILLLVVLPSVVVSFGPWVVRRFIPVEAIAENNEVAGFKFATLGVVYAVLLGLAVISVWEKYSEAESAATEEAAALASIERLSNGLVADEGRHVREAIRRYASAVIADDWPAMARGDSGRETHEALENLYAVTLGLTAADQRGATLLEALLTQLNYVTESRRERLDLADGILPSVVWLVLFAGAAVTIGFTFFFGLDNLSVQMLMTGLLALLISLSLFVAVSIDHPFAGPSEIQPAAMERILHDFTNG